jgi:Rv2525c-like, glycoside hydrolase-like domain
MRRASFATLLLFVFPALFVLPPALKMLSSSRSSTPKVRPEDTPQPPTSAYLGFDLNTYPGDDALPVLRKTFSFGGFWLSIPPGAKENTWTSKRQAMLSAKFGFLILYNGPLSKELKSAAQATNRGSVDALKAAATAKKEGFPAGSIIFVDIEEGGRLPANYHAYLRAWVDGLARAAYRAGAYCSGMPVSEGNRVTIFTADDIRNSLGKRDMTYFVYNDACPPSPGCVVAHNPPPPSASGVPYAAVWQFAQSPVRKQFAGRCAATYNADGNCYAPGDAKHAWFLDLNSATTPDPSSPRNRNTSTLFTLGPSVASETQEEAQR